MTAATTTSPCSYRNDCNLPLHQSADKTQTMRKRRKSTPRVTFNPRARIRLVPTIDSYTNEEFHSYWYGIDDLASILQDAFCVVERMELHLPIDEAVECTRGLEKRIHTAMEARRRERAQLLETIARGYYMQKQYDHHESEEALALKYRRLCSQDEESARLMGIVDEEEALKIFLHDASQVLLMAEGDNSADIDDEEEESLCYEHHDEVQEHHDQEQEHTLAMMLRKGESGRQSGNRQLSILFEDSLEFEGEQSIKWEERSEGSMLSCTSQ